MLVDTAGLRRKRRQRQGIEYYSELRALDAAERADVALVLVDTTEGLVDQDLAVADVARKANCSTLVVLSKWDVGTVKVEDVRPRIEQRLRQRPRLVTVSAKSGRGIARLLDRVEELFARHTSRIATPELNRFLDELRAARQPPSRARRRLNLLYGTQTQVRPPRFRFFVNDPSLVTRDYGYWVENELRAHFGLEGVPVSIDFVRRSSDGMHLLPRHADRSSSAGRAGERPSRGCSPTAATRSRSPAATPSRRRRSPTPAATRAI